MVAAFRIAALLLLLACAGAGGPGAADVERAVSAGDLQQAAILAEQRRDLHPDDPAAHEDLGEVYYRLAREALDEQRFEEYEAYLERALDAWIEALRLAPESPSPHLWMGILAAYQGDLDRALVSFQNARRLGGRNPIHYSNLAEIYMYRGEIANARRYLDKAHRLGGPPVVLDITGSLVAWRAGDLVEAKDLFRSAYYTDPGEVNTWNEAPVSDPIESFEDFTAYCCSHVACGPYMEAPCKRMALDIARRKTRDETIRRELLLEMERRRKLEEIYRERRDLQVEIEEAGEAEVAPQP